MNKMLVIETVRHTCEQGKGNIPIVGHVEGEKVRWGNDISNCPYCGEMLPNLTILLLAKLADGYGARS